MRVTINSVAVVAWEHRRDSVGDGRYAVYRIQLRDSTGQEWTVYRRYSDFIPLDEQVRRILGPALGEYLPAREVWRPLVGMLGMSVGEPGGDFLEERRRGLDRYVKAILAVAGGGKTALWNHPAVLTFFDIPTVVQSSSNDVGLNASPSTGTISLAEWSREMEMTRRMVQEALKTRKYIYSGGEATSRHLRRQTMAIERRLDRLQRSLDRYAQIERVDDQVLIGISAEFQQLVRECKHLERAETLAIPIVSSSPNTITPIARTPVRASSLLASSSIERISSEQKMTMENQDRQLSELSSIIQRHKAIGVAIGDELDEQAHLLDNLQDGVEGAQTRLNIASRRVKKL